jgi:hypothetical protein
MWGRDEPLVRKKFLLFAKMENIVSTNTNGQSEASSTSRYTYWLHVNILCV